MVALAIGGPPVGVAARVDRAAVGIRSTMRPARVTRTRPCQQVASHSGHRAHRSHEGGHSRGSGRTALSTTIARETVELPSTGSGPAPPAVVRRCTRCPFRKGSASTPKAGVAPPPARTRHVALVESRTGLPPRHGRRGTACPLDQPLGQVDRGRRLVVGRGPHAVVVEGGRAHEAASAARATDTWSTGRKAAPCLLQVAVVRQGQALQHVSRR